MSTKEKIKTIIHMTWPFAALLVVVIFSWNYIRQFLPDDWGEQEPAASNPVVVYDMREDQDDLSPMDFRTMLERKEKFFSAEELAVLYKKSESAGPGDDLAAVIEKTADGAVIALAPGEYRVNLAIGKNLTLAGAGESTVLTAADGEKPVIKSAGAKLVLANMAIADAKIGLSAEGGEAEVKRVKFERLSATACYGNGVKLNFSESYIYNSLSALKLIDSSGNITDAIIKDNAKSGVELRRSDFAVTGNVITGNKSYGVFLDGYAAAEIKNNFISGNKGWNVRIEGERRIYR